MNEVFNTLAAWLADVLLLGSALLLLAHAALGFIQQPAWRMPLAWGTLLGLLLLALLSVCPFWPRQSLAPRMEAVLDQTPALPPIIIASDVTTLLPSSATSPGLLVASDTVAADSLAEALAVLQEVASSSSTGQRPQSPLIANLVRVWLGGAAIALGWIALGAWQAARLLRRSQQSPEWSRHELAQLVARKRREPRLRVSERIVTAVALGTRRPHILLPAHSVQPENIAGVRAALAHEWAHIRHGDLWLLALERLLLPLFFWHPLFWLLRRRVRFDQELLADAAAAGEQPLEYAEALLAWAKSAVSSPSRPPLGMAALSLWENPQSLSRRVEMILQAKHPMLPNASRLWRLLVTASLLALVLGLSLVTVRPTATAQEGADQLTDRTAKKYSSARKKKQKKAREEARAAVSLDGRTYPDPRTADRVRTSELPVQMNLMIYELPHNELTVAKTDLGDFLQETSRECRAEDHLIIADYTEDGLQDMLLRLNKEPDVEILSRPKIMTPSDKEAHIQVSTLIPLMVIDETVNGKTDSRLESLNAGIELTITPHLHPGHKVELEIVLERARVQPGNKAAHDEKSLPVLKRRKVQLHIEVLLGETVVIAEQSRKSDDPKPGPILLLMITPTQPATGALSKTQPPNPNTPTHLVLRGKEGKVRVEAVEREAADLQLAVQRGLQWLRKHQAGDQADKIERVAHPQAESTIKLLVELLKQHDGEKLAKELEQQAQALRLRRLEMESANYRDGVQMLHRENDALRAQVTQLQKKLNDTQAQLLWLREAATAEGREKVSDEEFLRRVYLDLKGILPTADEARAFSNDKNAEKRSKLLDRLLSATAPPLPGGDDRVVKVFALKYTPAQRVMDMIKQLQQEGKTKIELQAISPDVRTNSILVAGKEADLVIIGNVIATLDQAGSPPAESPTNDQADGLAQRLKALDVREAEINLKAARTKLERYQTLAKAGEGSVPREELHRAAAEMAKAEVMLEQVQARGDRLKSQQLEVRLAEVQLRAAQVNLERTSALVESGQITTTELDAARFDVEKAEVMLERARAKLAAVQP